MGNAVKILFTYKMNEGKPHKVLLKILILSNISIEVVQLIILLELRFRKSAAPAELSVRYCFSFNHGNYSL